jgi:putative ATPase
MGTRSRRLSSTPRETLFSDAEATGDERRTAPLAARMRPRALVDLVGQRHLLTEPSPLRNAIENDCVRSIVLWGPPGSGKTSVARIIAEKTRAHFVAFSAVLGGIGELTDIVSAARDRAAFTKQKTTVFVDEVHRFNKSQQDAFLPHVEDGTVVLVAATTENPSFAVNAALLSRCTVLRLEPLSVDDLVSLLERALSDSAHGLGSLHVAADADALRAIADHSSGDARRALSTLEAVVDSLTPAQGGRISVEAVAAVGGGRPLLHDKTGEHHHNVISAFIKSMRGSDPDASVYWMMRMLEAGDDPLFVSRRMMVFASEDVGNADPRGLLVATAADAVLRRVGLPEATYALAQACIYLACAPKSNAASVAWHRAKELIDRRGALPVPRKLCNPVTALMRSDGYGAGYVSPHDTVEGAVLGERYLPQELGDTVLYEPTGRGEEEGVQRRLGHLRAARERRG